MKKSGFDIKSQLKYLDELLTAKCAQFENSKYYFEDGDQPADPIAQYHDIEQLQLKKAKLQTLQGKFAQEIKVEVGGEKVPLAFCLKQVIGLGKAEKAWREMSHESSIKEGRRWQADGRVRSKDTIMAKRTIPIEQATNIYLEHHRKAEEYRRAISEGNSKRITISENDQYLFE